MPDEEDEVCPIELPEMGAIEIITIHVPTGTNVPTEQRPRE